MSGLIIGGIVVGIGVVGASFYWSATARIRRGLRRAPRTKIADAVEGQLVRFDGQVVDGPSLVAPLTGRRCVFYLAIVDEYVSHGKSGRWHQRIKEQRGVRFAIDDGSGRATVDPSGARLDVELDRTTRSGRFDDATAVEQAFLERHGRKSTGWVFNKHLRYREGAIEIGEAIAAAGQAVRALDPDGAHAAGERDCPPSRLHLGGSGRHPLLLSDARQLQS